MKHTIHIPTFLAASFFMILGLILESYTPVRTEDQIFSILLLLIGFILFFFTKRVNMPLYPQETPKFAMPLKMSVIIFFIGLVFWLYAGGMYTKLLHFLGGLLTQNLVR